MESKLISRQIIEGELSSLDKSTIVKSVDVIFGSVNFMNMEIVDNKFKLEITDRFESGNYEVNWNVTINGKDTIVKDSFIVSTSNIDPSLPLDLQNLA